MSYPRITEHQRAANAARSTDALSNTATEDHTLSTELASRRSSGSQQTLRQSRRLSAVSDATDTFKSAHSSPRDDEPPTPLPEPPKVAQKPSTLESAAGSTPRPTIVLPLPQPEANTKQPPLRSAASEGELPAILRHHQSIVTFLLAEKHIHTLVSPKRRRRRRRQSGLPDVGFTTILHHPLSIIFAQLIILGLAWTFFVVMLFEGPLTLPPSVTQAAKNNPQLLTLVVTLIATAISTLSSFFFGLSVRLIVNHYLTTRSMSIFSLGTSIRILSRGLVVDKQHGWWTTAALLALVVNSTLIAAWSALITPVSVVIDSTETLGFSQEPGVINIILLPITCISLASLVLVFIVLFQRMLDSANARQEEDHGLEELNSESESRRASQVDPSSSEPSPDTNPSSPSDNRKSTATMTTGKTHTSAAPSTSNPPTILTRSIKENSAHFAHEIALFDAADPFHLLAVTSAGGITGIVRDGLGGDAVRMSHPIRLRLGRVDRSAGAGAGGEANGAGASVSGDEVVGLVQAW